MDDETGEVHVTHLWQCFDVGRAINPTLVEGQIEGGGIMGLGLAVLETCYPYYPSVEHRGSEFGAYIAPGIEDLPDVQTILIENPSADGPFGAKGISEMANNPQPPAIAAAVYDAIGVWVTELPITPERVLRALEKKRGGEDGPTPRGQARDLRRGALGQHARSRGQHLSLRRSRVTSPFRTWNGVEPFRIFPTVDIHAIGGEQVLLCRVVYEPGTTVARHAHDDTEQLMLIAEGDVTMTIGDETKTLGPGDVAVVNRGVEHELYSENGLVFIEALAPFRSITCPTANATSCSVLTAARCTWSDRRVNVTLLLCDFAEAVNGKLYVMGGGWNVLFAPGQPVTMSVRGRRRRAVGPDEPQA